MSSKGFGQPLWIDTRQGWLFALLHLSVGAVSLVCLLVTELDLALRLSLSLLCLALLVGSWREGRVGRRLFVDDKGGIHLQFANDERRACRLLGRPLSLFGLTFLILMDESGAKYPLTIDSSLNPMGATRRLLVAARHGASPAKHPLPSRLDNPRL